MLTTFARIAKILKGLVEPRNWVEEAFGDISGGGGGGGVLIVHVVDNTLDKTWKEIKDADFAVVIYESSDDGGLFREYYTLTLVTHLPPQGEDPLQFFMVRWSDEEEYMTNDENGYPVLQNQKP